MKENYRDITKGRAAKLKRFLRVHKFSDEFYESQPFPLNKITSQETTASFARTSVNDSSTLVYLFKASGIDNTSRELPIICKVKDIKLKREKKRLPFFFLPWLVCMP